MTELKTLKDMQGCLTCDCPNLICSYTDELKFEAIRWIKVLETDKFEGLPMKLTMGSGSPHTMIDWIKHFFNISDEDLKS